MPIISARRIPRRWATARSTCWPSMCSAWPAPSRSDADDLYAEVITALPYATLPRETFDRIVDFVATGGYALKSYERFAKIRRPRMARGA